MTPISIIRHPKERRSKCSLTPLEGRADISYYKAREGWSFDVTGFTVLALGAQELSADCLLYTSPSPRDPKTSRMPSSA